MSNKTSFSTTQLDFSNIKEELKLYFQRRSEFNDYDFDASGINNILDVLAYNTHYNALLSNFSLNEAYLSSAQLRSSVVNIAQALGYNIRSRTAARASVRLSLNLQSAGIRPSLVTLPVNTKFTTSVDGVSYTFQTRTEYIAVDDGLGVYEFLTEAGSPNIPIFEGVLRTKTFIVQEEEERQIFVIPDETIDTNTALVRVFDTFTSNNFVAYVNIVNTTNITPDSTFYRINEAPNGFYEVGFGDGITTGKKPQAGNKVEVTYLSCVGSAANGAAAFSPVSQISIGGTSYTLGVSVVSASASGAEKQSINSIKLNAPLGFAAQKRLVTAEDYRTTILSNFSAVNDAVAWGGEDNDPPDYGKVYIGLLFDNTVSEDSKASIKSEITNDFNENLAILSIDSVFVDPVITYLNITVNFSFNPSLTGLTQGALSSRVSAAVDSYVSNNLQSFRGVFRKSNLATEIDNISDAIPSTEIKVTLQQRLTPITTATVDDNSRQTTYTITFPVPISPPDDVDHTVTSSLFFYSGVICTIRNKLLSNKLQIIDQNENVLIDNIGEYNSKTGKIILSGFAPGIIVSGDPFIKIFIKPENDNTINPLRNYYLDLDKDASVINAVIDRSASSINL